MKKFVFAALAAVFMMSSGFVASNFNEIKTVSTENSPVNDEELFEFCNCNLINFYYNQNGDLRAEIRIIQTQSQSSCRSLQSQFGYQSSAYDDLSCQSGSSLNNPTLKPY
jgi:opacity protein-like surface antigen